MSRQEVTRVCVIYPADPLGTIAGGIDTFIRGVLRWAPDDIQLSIVGVTTDIENRPANQWKTWQLGGRDFQFYPVIDIKNSERQAKMPVTLRFLIGLSRRSLKIRSDVLEFHRVEPCLAFLRDKRPKTLVMHQNMNVLHDAGSDIRWKYFPGMYFMLERLVVPQLSSIYCVREDAAASYRERFPAMVDDIHFTATWVDTEIFEAPSMAGRRMSRELMNREFGFTEDEFVLISVGRLDKQKNPLLLLEAFKLLHESMPDVRLLFVGDGILRRQIDDRVTHCNLGGAVRLCGVKPASAVSQYLQASDAFVLSSAYEGMPMCVLEALGSGLPVVSTNVGEVSRIVRPQVNGELVTLHSGDALADAIRQCRANIRKYRGKPCTDAVASFTPQKVLAPIYENYRELASRGRDVDMSVKSSSKGP